MENIKTTVDLHIHSNASDGTDTIPELLEAIKAAGIRIFSVTDHDTTEGAIKMERIVPGDMKFIRGIEFSCKTEAGKCHILGYGYDNNAEAFENLLQKGREKRRNKLERRISFLMEKFGDVFTEEELRSMRERNSVGKPHLGNLLVLKGLAEDRNQAIEQYINPCRTESDRLEGQEVIRGILAAGGIPVWAHPYGGTGEKEVSGETFRKQLQVLMEAGLRGLECHYSKYTKEQVDSLIATAERHHLLISGGSDYHGRNKNIAPGVLNNQGLAVETGQLTLLGALS